MVEKMRDANPKEKEKKTSREETSDYFCNAFETILAETGSVERVTREAVRIRFGGSPQTIGPLLKNWKREKQLALPAGLPAPVQQASAKAIQAIWRVAEEQAMLAKANVQAELKALQTRFEQFTRSTEDQINGLKDALGACQRERDAHKASSEVYRGEMTEATAALREQTAELLQARKVLTDQRVVIEKQLAELEKVQGQLKQAWQEREECERVTATTLATLEEVRASANRQEQHLLQQLDDARQELKRERAASHDAQRFLQTKVTEFDALRKTESAQRVALNECQSKLKQADQAIVDLNKQLHGLNADIKRYQAERQAEWRLNYQFLLFATEEGAVTAPVFSVSDHAGMEIYLPGETARLASPAQSLAPALLLKTLQNVIPPGEDVTLFFANADQNTWTQYRVVNEHQVVRVDVVDRRWARELIAIAQGRIKSTSSRG